VSRAGYRHVRRTSRVGWGGTLQRTPQDYWESNFSDQGYALHKKWTAAMQAVDEFYSRNMMVFRQIDAATIAVQKPR
jgi:hypothetical protein